MFISPTSSACNFVLHHVAETEKKLLEISQWQDTEIAMGRSGDDMQYAFAYYHFLALERRRQTPREVIEDADRDADGQLSANELQTLVLQYKRRSPAGDAAPPTQKILSTLVRAVLGLCQYC